MKQQVLKALANPPRIFYVPYTLAIINFVIWFVFFMGWFAFHMIITRGDDGNILVYFLATIIITHYILVLVSRNEPMLGQILIAKIKMIKDKIPKRLIG